MSGLLERLKQGDVLVGDGAWGTQLMQRGLPEGKPPEWFALERPDVIEEVARLYVDAGADLVTTDTFGATSLRLRSHGLEHETARVNREAVQAVKRAVGVRAFVSASVGPTGQLLEPLGDLQPEAAEAAFAEQIAVLVEAGADVICIETMTDLGEASRALAAARRVAGRVPVMVTMTFQSTPRGFFTAMGTSVEQAVRTLEAGGADVVGSNCGNGIAEMVGVARAIAGHTQLPVVIQPNAGLPEMRGDTLVYRETADALAARVPELLAAGVRIVGGCCGTTPDHTRAIRRAVDARRVTVS